MITSHTSRSRAVFYFTLLVFHLFISNCYAIDLSQEEKDYLRTKDTIVFVSQTRYPPFEFIDANQQHEGMMVDIVRWIAVEAGFQPLFVDMPFQQAQEAVLSGKADLLTSLFHSEKRQEKFEFTNTLFDVPASIFVKAERTDIKDLTDLNGKTIAIQKGDYAKEFLESRNIQFNRVDTQDFSEAIDTVRAGKADAVIGDEQIVLYHLFSNRLTDHIKKVGAPLYIGKNCMAANKNNALLITILNKGIHQARKSGVLDKISKKWLGTKFGPQPSFLEQYLWPISVVAGSLLIVSLGVWGWNVRLRTLVRKKTAEIAHSEAALRESEEKFRSIFNNSLDGIVYATPDGRIIAANPSVCEMLGWSEQELCEGGRDLIVDATDPRLLKAIEEPIRSGRFRGEINHRRKDGTIFPVEISKTLFSLANGTMRTSLIFRDISKRKQAEESRRREHTFRDTIIDNVTEGLCVCHATTEYPFVRFTIWNNQMTNITGYTMEEINRLGWYQTLYPDPELQARAMERMKRIRQGGDLRTEEWEITCANGIQRVLNISTSSVESDDGQVHVLALIHDVTERKASEDKLNKIMREQQIILDNANIGISLVVERRQVWVNRKSVEMFQYEKEAMEGQTTRNLYPSQEAYEQLGRDAYPVLAQGNTYETEQQLIRRDGTPIWVKYNGKAIDSSDLSLGTIWLLEDVTEHKRIEEERKQWERQRQQIQKADSLNRMAGAIAHHYNNMLGAVMGNLEMAMEDLPQQGEAFTHLSAALQATSKAAEVSGLMLTYLGQAITKLDLLDLSDVCSRTLPALRIIVKEKIVLETDVPSPGPAIHGNANQIQQTLKNLVSNASEAIGDSQGTIYLQVKTVALADIPTAHRFPIDWKPEDKAFACLEVKDSGTGIADEEIEHIFDPFFSSKFTGRGLGLPVVLGILRTHRGVVTVESDPNRGSIFRVFFPLSAEPIPFRAENTAHDMKMEESGTVLLVEDEEMVCELTNAMLARLGFTVLVAKDGIEAIEVFRQHRDDIRAVLCDLIMPRMDGWETLTALRALAPHLPIILTSGYDEAHVMQDGRPEQPQAFLQKPFKKQELQMAFEKALKSSVH